MSSVETEQRAICGHTQRNKSFKFAKGEAFVAIFSEVKFLRRSKIRPTLSLMFAVELFNKKLRNLATANAFGNETGLNQMQRAKKVYWNRLRVADEGAN